MGPPGGPGPGWASDRGPGGSASGREPGSAATGQAGAHPAVPPAVRSVPSHRHGAGAGPPGEGESNRTWRGGSWSRGRSAAISRKGRPSAWWPRARDSGPALLSRPRSGPGCQSAGRSTLWSRRPDRASKRRSSAGLVGVRRPSLATQSWPSSCTSPSPSSGCRCKARLPAKRGGGPPARAAVRPVQWLSEPCGRSLSSQRRSLAAAKAAAESPPIRCPSAALLGSSSCCCSSQVTGMEQGSSRARAPRPGQPSSTARAPAMQGSCLSTGAGTRGATTARHRCRRNSGSTAPADPVPAASQPPP